MIGDQVYHRETAGELWLVVPRPELGDEREAFVTRRPEADTRWWKEYISTCIIVNLQALLARMCAGTTTCEDAHWLKEFFKGVANDG